MAVGDADRAFATVLFGPQYHTFEADRLSTLRRRLQTDPSLVFLADAIRELPSIWQSLLRSCPELRALEDRGTLEALTHFMQARDDSRPPVGANLVLAPLTIISHIIDYVDFDPSILGDHSGVQVRDVQGFCIGFLAAVSIASSDGSAAFKKHAATCVWLSACIGAVIDAEQARHQDPLDKSSAYAIYRKSEIDVTTLERLLSSTPEAYVSCSTDRNKATITLPARDADSIASRVATSGFSLQAIGLRGRFHHPIHRRAAQRLSALCETDERLRLPNAEQLILPLWSNATAQRIQSGSLHEIAIDSILTQKARWYDTVSTALQLGPADSKVGLKVFGGDGFVPRSLISRSHRLHGNDQESQEMRTASSDIAVVGMACRFPNADNLEEFWDLIEEGENCVREFPKERYHPASVPREPKASFFGNFLKNPDVFDHRFFGISSREAKSMDPQQRLLLHVTYEALEASGYFSGPQEGLIKEVGCYLGAGSVDYESNVASHDATAFSALGTLRAFLSGRLNHHFGWTGPSITFDTACSSSAVAIHSACQALKLKECEMAIAGGVHVMTSPWIHQNLAAASFLNPNGASRAFDAGAGGYCRGEGAGLLVLKPLKRALADGNTILGVIGGSAVNQGSNCSPITVPVSESQTALYRQVLHASGVLPTEVSFVEAHGTGTPVGDPVEVASIRQTFGGPDRKDVLFVGSVKDNIGHAEGASGVAATIKALLMMQKRKIPPQANFTTLNPRIPALEPDQMAVPTKTQTWGSSRPIAVVNNYGAAGSNAALLLKQWQGPQRSRDGKNLPSTKSSVDSYPIFLSAKSPDSLRSYCATLRSALADIQEPNNELALRDISYNITSKANFGLEYSLVSTVASVSELKDQLQAATQESRQFLQRTSQPPPVVLCFSGQTGDRVFLSRDLFDNCSILRDHLVECNTTCRDLGLPEILPRIFDAEPIADIVLLHCALLSLQYSSAKSWIDSGIQVDTLVGHSFGQLTALCVSGSLSLRDTLLLVSGRAELIQNHWGPDTGAMISIEGDLQDVKQLIAKADQERSVSDLDIACHNGPKSFVLAGSHHAIETLEDMLASDTAARPVKARRLDNTHAFHSRLTDSITGGLRKIAETLSIKEPSLFVETCTPDQSWSEVNATRLVEHSREPVYFADAIQRISDRLPSAIWLEASSRGPVIPMVKRAIASSSAYSFFPSDLYGAEALRNLSKTTTDIWSTGTYCQFWPFNKVQKEEYSWINLPPYQFEQSRHWLELELAPQPAEVVSDSSPAKQSELIELVENSKTSPNEHLFSINPEHPVFRYLVQGHAVLGHGLGPASMYFELAVRAAKLLLGTNTSQRTPHMQDVKILYPIFTEPSGNLFLTLSPQSASDDGWSVRFFSRHNESNQADVDHATANIALLNFRNSVAASRFRSLGRLIKLSHCESIAQSLDADGLTGSAVYKVFDEVVKYTDYYRGVKRIFAQGGEVVGHVSLPSNQLEGHTLSSNPIALDNFLQVAGIHTNCLYARKDGEFYMCTGIGGILMGEDFASTSQDQQTWVVYSNFETSNKNRLGNDIFILDQDSGKLVLTIMDAQFTSVPFKAIEKALNAGGVDAKDEKKLSSPKVTESTQEAVKPPANDEETVTTAPIQNPGESRKSGNQQAEVFDKLKLLLSEVLDIPADEITTSSALEDMGVDSLMITEVLSEIKRAFDVTISPTEFQDLSSVQSLCNQLGGGDSPASETTKSSASSSPSPKSPVSVGTPLSSQSSIGDVADLALEKEPVVFSSLAHSSFSKTKDEYDAIAEKTKFLGFRDSVHPMQSQLVTAYVVEAFAQIGCPLQKIRPGDSVPEIEFSPKHRKVVSQLYTILADAGLIESTGKGYRRTKAALPSQPSQALHDSILKLYPQHEAEHRLLQTTGARLAECLTDRVDPLGLLFKDVTARKLMGEVYEDAPMFKTGTVLLANYLSEILNGLDSRTEIRILELGAGTGGTTSYLLERLSQCTGKFRYTFTDLSSSLVAAAKRKFQKYPFMEYKIVDIEQDPKPQDTGRYDVVISTNCIHATKNLVRSTSNIRKLLQPNGILCLVELTRNLYWFDLVFGLVEGWWLFNDGRKHVLAHEKLWSESLTKAGFNWVDWSNGTSSDSDILRVITASPSNMRSSQEETSTKESNTSQETVLFKEVDGTKLYADIYYPGASQQGNVDLPVALMIHGGGHVMLSRKDVRTPQTKLLLKAGFLPVSVDYRLCPELTLPDGPMRDVSDALQWARTSLPSLPLRRRDIRPDGKRVVAVGWSTGGHLAMTLAFTSLPRELEPPQAILAFYCPSDYEDQHWTRPNVPYRESQQSLEASQYDLLEGVSESPLTAYNVPAGNGNAKGGWMSASDPRSRIALHMNWRGQTLPVLLNGLRPHGKSTDLPQPSSEQIKAISPLAQIKAGRYKTPTFIIHGTDDDLIPWQQAQRTYEALVGAHVKAEVRILKDIKHLFDILGADSSKDYSWMDTVREGYDFLQECVE